MTRADRIAAALEHWKKWAEYLRAFSGNTLGRAADAGDALAALLREPQPAPVVGDDDAALLAKTQDWLCHNLTVTPDSHYRNVQALLERCSAALADVARLTEKYDDARSRIASLDEEVEMTRAALATAEEAQAKAVDEEREACLSDIRAQAPPRDVRTVATEAQVSVLNHAIAAIRARAGRHHAG